MPMRPGINQYMYNYALMQIGPTAASPRPACSEVLCSNNAARVGQVSQFRCQVRIRLKRKRGVEVENDCCGLHSLRL